MQEEIKKKSRNLKIQYLYTSMLSFVLVFMLIYFFLVIFLTIVRAHPYFYLATALLAFIADIYITNYLINVYWKDRWKIKD